MSGNWSIWVFFSSFYWASRFGALWEENVKLHFSLQIKLRQLYIVCHKTGFSSWSTFRMWCRLPAFLDSNFDPHMIHRLTAIRRDSSAYYESLIPRPFFRILVTNPRKNELFLFHLLETVRCLIMTQTYASIQGITWIDKVKCTSHVNLQVINSKTYFFDIHLRNLLCGSRLESSWIPSWSFSNIDRRQYWTSSNDVAKYKADFFYDKFLMATW